MTSVNVLERMYELNAGVTRLFHATTEGRRGPNRKSRFRGRKEDTGDTRDEDLIKCPAADRKV